LKPPHYLAWPLKECSGHFDDGSKFQSWTGFRPMLEKGSAILFLLRGLQPYDFTTKCQVFYIICFYSSIC
jgi:hypothetical protein